MNADADLRQAFAEPIQGHADGDETEVPPVDQRLLDLARTAGPAAAVMAALSPELVPALVALRYLEPARWEALMLALKAAGVRGEDITAIRRATRRDRAEQPRRLRAVEPGERSEPAPLPVVRDEWPEAPVAPDCVFPPGILARSGGLVSETAGDPPRRELVTSARLVVSGRTVDQDTGAESLTLAWSYGTEPWSQHTAPRGTVLDARGIVPLATQGLPVSSGTSRAAVDYLAAYEACNRPSLPTRRTMARMGWTRDESGFVCGQTYLGDGDPIHYQPPDAGEAQYAEHCRTGGDLAGWLDLAGLVEAYPAARLVLVAGLAAVALRILGCGNFALGLYGPTSSGKTTALLPAAGAWGFPGQPGQGVAGLIGTWRTTPVQLERRAVAYCDHPLLLDDTALAPSPEAVTSGIYDITSGTARGRGSTRGAQRTGTWRTVLLTTGEARSGPGVMGGACARELAWDRPIWPGATPEVIQTVQRQSSNHYGHAGPVMAGWLLSNRDAWDPIRRRYQDLLDRYTARAGTNTVAGRLGAALAAIDTTAQVAHRVLGLSKTSPVEPLYDDLLAETDGADTGRAAMRSVLAWASACVDQWLGRRSSVMPPAGGWLGRWDVDCLGHWERLCVYPHRLQEHLVRGGYSYNGCLRSWRDRGWLDVSGDRGGLTCKVRIDNDTAWMVCIRQEAADA